MNFFSDSMYTAGQMAKLSRITKDALFFYEEKGLISPSYIAENGYRYYSIDEFYRLDMITILRFLGSSVKEIKDFFDNMSTDNYIALLEDKIEYIEKEKARLDALKQNMSDSLYYSKLAFSLPVGVVKIEFQEDEFILMKKLKEDDSAFSFANTFSDLMKEASTLRFFPDIHVGMVVSLAQLQVNNYSPDYCFCACPENTKSHSFHIKPAGNYATLIHKGSYKSISDSYTLITDYLKENNLVIVGNSYEKALIGWFNCTSQNDYVTHISVQVDTR